MVLKRGIENIISVYNRSWEGEREHGMLWYKKARAFCRAQVKEYGVSLDVVIACLSALSPRNKWENNLKDTITVLEAVRQGKLPFDIKVSTFNANKEKAFNVVSQKRPALVKLSNKTAAFFDNIRHVNSTQVTVDVHAYSIFMGKATQAKGLTDKEYAKVTKAYQIAAERLGMKPYELQAITWVAWRRLLKVGDQMPMPWALSDAA